MFAPGGLEEEEPAVRQELLLLLRQLVEAGDGPVGEPRYRPWKIFTQFTFSLGV